MAKLSIEPLAGMEAPGTAWDRFLVEPMCELLFTPLITASSEVPISMLFWFMVYVPKG
jgi:hypothetical protein